MKVDIEIDKDFFLDLVKDEMNDELENLNKDLVNLVIQEKYEEAQELNEAIRLFIFDSSKLIQKNIGGKAQEYYNLFCKQNSIIYKEMIEKVIS